MSKRPTKHRHSDSHASERHQPSNETSSTNGVLSNTERRLLNQRIAELERVVAALQVANARDSVSPNAKSRSRARHKSKRLTLQNPLTVMKRSSTPFVTPSKGSLKPSKSTTQFDEPFSAHDLDLDAELEEDDEFDNYEDYSDLDESDDTEEYEEGDISDVASVESSFDDSSSVASGSTLPYLDPNAVGRDGEADADVVKKFRENLERNQVLVLPSMLDMYPSLLNHNFSGSTTLQMVIQRRSVDLLKLLLDNPQLDINERYSQERNIAHWLLLDVEPLENHHVECLELILKMRPDFAFLETDASDNPPLWYAITRAQSYSQIVETYCGRDEERAERAEAQMNGYLRCTQALANLDPNALGKHKLPVLSLTVQLGFYPAFEILMAAKANPNAQDFSGDTPLHHLLNAMTQMTHEMSFARAASHHLRESSHPGTHGPIPSHNSHHSHHSHHYSPHSVQHPHSSEGSGGAHLSTSSSLSSSSNPHLNTSHPSGVPTSTQSISQHSTPSPAPGPGAQLTKSSSLELSHTRDINQGPLSPLSPLSPRFTSSTSAMGASQTITPTASSSSIRSTHSAVLEVGEDLPGVRLTDTVRRMCVALLKENANIYLANHQHITPYAKSLLRPEIHILFENYNPGTKVWKYRITSLEIGELIGSGAFGEVYLAKLHGSEFAVKMIELAEASKHEAGIMTDIRHPNILTFVGMYLPPAGAGDKVGLVTEYLPMGSLSNYLGFFKDRSPAPTTISWPMMMRIALTVARGMAWLHSREPAIYHHDLHAGNVLLATELGDTKLCDFGLSRVHGRAPAQHYDRIRAPERVLGPASDVYCFGFLLYQILYAEKANKDRINTLAQHFASGLAGASDISSVEMKIKMRRPWFKPPPGFALHDPDPWPPGSNVCYFDIAHLIVQCTLTNPNDRPNFEKIVELLERLSTPQGHFRSIPIPRYVPATPHGYSTVTSATTPVSSGYVDE